MTARRGLAHFAAYTACAAGAKLHFGSVFGGKSERRQVGNRHRETMPFAPVANRRDCVRS
jgi:hypothetical protein